MKEELSKFILDDTVYETKLNEKYIKRPKKYVKPNPKEIKAFIPGNIKQIFVKKGQTVKEGDSLLLLEAMKMENNVKAPLNGTIKSIHIKLGQMVPKNTLLIEMD